jgi:hypothetical protein
VFHLYFIDLLDLPQDKLFRQYFQPHAPKLKKVLVSLAWAPEEDI